MSEEAITPSPGLVRNEQTFADIVALISASRLRALRAVNTALVELYWQIGEIISRKLERAEWGDSVVEELAQFIRRTHPGLRGFTRANLFRMRQFYETYRQEEKVAPLVRQLPWSHNLVILGQTRRPEEREFYLRLAIAEGWSRRELERQMRTGLFERTVLSPPQVSPVARQTHPDLAGAFRDSYMLEFLELPPSPTEADLHRGLLSKLKEFLIELGRDFCFIGSEFPVQVGGRDFAIDLLFFHRGLNSLVAFELKVGRFEPEYLGKLGFYLEALDRDVRKAHEQPSIGVCATKDDEVVEYALSRNLDLGPSQRNSTSLPPSTSRARTEHRVAGRRAKARTLRCWK